MHRPRLVKRLGWIPGVGVVAALNCMGDGIAEPKPPTCIQPGDTVATLYVTDSLGQVERHYILASKQSCPARKAA